MGVRTRSYVLHSDDVHELRHSSNSLQYGAMIFFWNSAELTFKSIISIVWHYGF